jgi:hypothetical protein
VGRARRTPLGIRDAWPADILDPALAPVAQGIEHRPPEAGAQVRILPGALPGAPCFTRENTGESTSRERYLKETANSYAQAKVALTRLQREIDEEAHPRTRLTIGPAIQQWLDVAEPEDTTRER